MYKIQLYIIVKNAYKTLAYIADRSAAIEYAMTVPGSIVTKNGRHIYG